MRFLNTLARVFQASTVPPSGHLIISGTGRTGTTLLVQLLTFLKFDTGFSLEETLGTVDPISAAGLERSIHQVKLPYVVKSPWLCDELSSGSIPSDVKIHAAIVPVRALHDAAASRARVYDEAKKQGLDPTTHPGTLWKVAKPEDQEAALAGQFYKLIWSLVESEVPIYFVRFPQFVLEPEYLYRSLLPIWKQHGVSKDALLRAHATIVRPDLVHSFDK